MSLTQEERTAILDAASTKTREEFAGEVSARTSLTQDDVLRLAKTAAEREAMARVLAEVTKATAANTAKAGAIRNIAGGVEALVRIVDLVI